VKGANSYEVIFILDPLLSDDAVEAEVEAVRDLATGKGGVVAEVQKWGKRRLAYEVKKKRDGHYVLMKVAGPPGVVGELERHFRISEPVLKGMVFKAEAPRKARFAAKSQRGREGVTMGAREVEDG
jgi:small subunit ribosomal protein S6